MTILNLATVCKMKKKKILTFFILLAFFNFKCENTQVAGFSKSDNQSTKDTTQSIKKGSHSMIFMTFYYGMSLKEFQDEVEKLKKNNSLDRNSSEALFEPVKDAKFKMCFNMCGINIGANESLVPSSAMTVEAYDQGLEFLEFFCDSITKKSQKELLLIYKEKYGNKYVNKNKSQLLPERSTNEIYAINSIRDEYAWQLSDGRNIELHIVTSQRAYKCRDQPKAKAFAFENIILGRMYENEWIKLHSREIKRSAFIKYSSKEFVQKEKKRQDVEMLTVDSIHSVEKKRIEKNKNNI